MGSRREREELGDSACAVSVSNLAGRVVGQNVTSRRLTGIRHDQPCWQVHTSIDGARELPCHERCAQELLRQGQERTRAVTIRGRPHQLCCASVNGKVISVLYETAPPRPETVERDARLTARELDVLRLLAEGLAVPAVAVKLEIRASTVRAHVEHMRKKLDVKTQAALVAVGFRRGLLQ